MLGRIAGPNPVDAATMPKLPWEKDRFPEKGFGNFDFPSTPFGVDDILILSVAAYLCVEWQHSIALAGSIPLHWVAELIAPSTTCHSFTIVAAVPVRLMKRDLLFIAEQMLPLLDDKRLEMVARSRGIKPKDGESSTKLLTAFVRKADESALGRLIVETVILLSDRTQSDGGKVLRSAAQVYKVDTDAIALKMKQEFAAKEKARSQKRIEPKSTAKALKKTA